jgi:hypothetical protein
MNRPVILLMAITVLLAGLFGCSEQTSPPPSPTVSASPESKMEWSSPAPSIEPSITSSVGPSETSNAPLPIYDQTNELIPSEIDRLFKMSKSQIIEYYGGDYKVIPTGAEGSYDGYYYESIGMSFTFSDVDDSLGSIDVGANRHIKGAFPGMSFMEIQEYLGETEIYMGWLETPYNRTFNITYIIGTSKYSFTSFEPDGQYSGLGISKNRKEALMPPDEYILIKGINCIKSIDYLDLSDLTLTNTDILPLPFMGELTGLSLHNNQLDDITVISGLEKLTSLSLGNNSIENIKSLSNLTNISWLYLNNNKITDLSALSHLTNLEVLDLSGNPITDLAPLSNLSKLTHLDLRDSNVTDWSPVEHVPYVFGRD